MFSIKSLIFSDSVAALWLIAVLSYWVFLTVPVWSWMIIHINCIFVQWERVGPHHESTCAQLIILLEQEGFIHIYVNKKDFAQVLWLFVLYECRFWVAQIQTWRKENKGLEGHKQKIQTYLQLSENGTRQTNFFIFRPVTIVNFPGWQIGYAINGNIVVLDPFSNSIMLIVA